MLICRFICFSKRFALFCSHRYVDPSLKLVQAHKTQWKENEKKKKPQQRFFWGNGNETEQLSSCRSDRNRIKTWKICQLCGGEMQVCVF